MGEKFDNWDNEVGIILGALFVIPTIIIVFVLIYAKIKGLI